MLSNSVSLRIGANTRRSAFAIALILPAIVVIVALIIYPIGKCIFMSFHATQFGEKAPYVGTGNYLRLFRSADFVPTVVTTLVYTIFSVIGCFIAAMGTALIANAPLRGRSAYRVVMTIPWAIPEVAACLIWSWILNYEFGIVNKILLGLRLIHEPVGWFMNKNLALGSVLVVTVWKIFPLTSLTLLAGLQTIDQGLYESAKIDGANGLQLFRHITLPSLKPVATILVLLTTIWSFRRFTIIWVLTQGGPGIATETIVIGVYRYAFKSFQMGYASALGVIGLILSSTITVLYLIYQSRQSREA
jgi:multiple sugar transport system permease protein